MGLWASINSPSYGAIIAHRFSQGSACGSGPGEVQSFGGCTLQPPKFEPEPKSGMWTPWMHPHHEGVPFLSAFSPKIGCILDFWIIWWFSIFFCTLWFWHPTSAIFVPGWFGWSRDLNENAWFLGVFINGGTPIAGWFIKENHWKISMCYSCYRKGFHRVVIC